MSIVSPRGFVLPQVMLALVVVAAFALLLNLEGPMTVEHVAAEAQATQVEFLTQAGLAHAEWQLQDGECSGDFNVPSTAIDTGSYVATATGMGTTTSYNLTVDQDAWIRSDLTTTNNGTNIDQHIRFESGNVEQALYRFDLSSLAAGAQINSASAWFYIEANKEHPEGAITAHRVTADWTETGATWDSMNGNFEASVLATILPQAQSSVWVRVNLTAQVQAWVNGQPNFGILFSSTAEGVHGEYVSREGAAGQQPFLDVEVGSAPISTATLQADGTLTNGVSRSLVRNGVAAYQPASYSFQQPDAAAGKDAFMKENDSGDNFGISPDLWIQDDGGIGEADTSLLEFNLDAAPFGARVLSATLELYADNDSSDPPGASIGVHRVTRAWIEGTFDDANGEASWDKAVPAVNWTNDGGDYDVSPVDVTAEPPGTLGWYAWDVTELVKGWTADTYANQGLALVADNGSTQVRFASSDNGNAAWHPKLTISYTCTCGTACLAPQGSGAILMAVGDDSTVDPADAAKKALFESWGYTVTLIDDSASQATYDSEVVNNDVAYISETVNGLFLWTKLKSAPIGVVSEEGFQNGFLGIASSYANPVSASINVTDNSHYITVPFPSGTLDIYLAAMGSLTVSGTPAPGLQELADNGGVSTLAVLAQGDSLEGGGTAAGRRVMLPLGRNGSFNWNYLNADGRLIVQRAIEWGKGTDIVPASLWVSTATDVTSSGAPGLDAWTNGEALEVADPNFALEPATTNGTFASMFNLDNFAGGNASVDAIHYVNADITVGSANSVDLYAGDVLLSTAANETLTSTNSLAVNREDVFVFRPDTPDDYSAGTFIFLIDGSQLHAENDTVGISLVEKDTTVGDGALYKYSFLVATTGQRDVIKFTPLDVGPGTTTGSFSEFIDGPSLSFGSEIRGLDLAETETAIGGQTVPAGSILLTLNADDPGGVGDNSVSADAADIFYLTVTTVGASPAADATLLFEGADVNLDSSGEHLQSLTLIRTAPGAATDNIILSTETDATLGGLSFADEDLARYAPDIDVATRYLDGSAVGNTQDVDAVHVLANGHLVLSTIGTATIGGVTFENEDLIDYDPVADSATLIFDGSALFTSGNTDISAVHVMDNGHLLLSNEYTAALGGVSFGPNDLVDYDPATDTATLYFDGDAVSFTGWIDAVHLLDNGHLVLSTDSAATLGGLSFGDDDLVDYDPVGDSAALYFDGSLFTDSENVRSAHVGPGSSSVVDPNAPFAHWKLDETSGPTAVDSEGGHDGTLSGPTWTPGIIDGGLQFNGSSDYVSVPDDDALDLVDGFTLMAWIYKDGTQDLDVVFQKGDAGNDWNYSLSTDDVEINMEFYIGGWIVFDTAQILQVDTWYHIAATFDNATNAIRIYLDGAEVLSDSMALDPVANDGQLHIGRSLNGDYFDGRLDDLRIFNYALDAAAIATYAAMGGDSCTASFTDDFESGGYEGGTGTWTSNWTEFNDDGDPGGQDERNTSWAGTQVLRVQDNNGGGEGVWRDLDLTGYTAATLSLTCWRSSLENASDWAALEYSTNGGDAWTEVARVEGPGTDPAGSPQTLTGIDMNGATGGNARFRVLTAPNMGGTDRVYFDDINICAD